MRLSELLSERLKPRIMVNARTRNLRPSDRLARQVADELKADPYFSGIALDLKAADEQTVEISYIENLTGVRGVGTRALEMLTGTADRLGVDLRLKATAMRGGMDQDGLESYYARFGFTVSDPELRVMKREAMMEAVGRQLVYHGTTLQAAIQILEDGHFLGFSGHVINGKPVRGLSTTRNPKMAVITNDLDSKTKEFHFGEKHHDEKLLSVTFVIDLTAVKQQHRVIPVDYFKGRTQTQWSWRQDHLKNARAESEEFIVIGRKDNLPVQNVVTKIIYAPYHQRTDYDEERELGDQLVKLATRLRIPFEYDHSRYDFDDRKRGTWNKRDYLSRVKYPSMVQVDLSSLDRYEKLVSLVDRYNTAAGPLSDAEVDAMFSPEEAVVIKDVWRVAIKSQKMPQGPLTNGYLRVMRNAIKRGSPSDKTVVVAVPTPPKRVTPRKPGK